MAKPNFTPTPRQIQAACKRIQDSWSPGEEYRRRTFPHLDDSTSMIPAYELPSMRAVDLLGERDHGE